MGRGGDGKAASRFLSVGEVKKHTKSEDGWVVIKNKVYDVSNFRSHPGGRVILSALGQTDSTDVFNAFHPGKTHELLADFYIGDLDTRAEAPCSSEIKTSPFEAEYRLLVGEMKASGLYKSDLFFYAYKFVSTTAILAASAAVTWHFGAQGHVLGQLGGGCLLALFWQQCGWLAHDLGHHQVFTTRIFNDYGILVIGNLYQGFSCEWWKNKHNTHHAIPNLLESHEGLHDGDPDIDTLPFLAWSEEMLAKAKAAGGLASPLQKFMLTYQAFLYFPLLFFARIVWALQSASFVFRFDSGVFDNSEVKVRAALDAAAGAASGKTVSTALKHDLIERLFLTLHYVGVAALCFGLTSSPLVGAAHFLIAQTVCGLLLAISFGLGHNGMGVFNPTSKPGFAELQVRTTRNVEDDALGLVGWFMGGLHLQLEHHLFPSIPRHNLNKVRDLIEPLCKKHGVKYHSTNMWDGTVEVLSQLSNVARALKEI